MARRAKLPYCQQRPSGLWRGYARLKGRQVWSASFKTEQEAYDAAMRMRSMAHNTQLGETLSEAAQALFEQVATNRTDGSLRWYQGHLTAIMRLIPGRTPLAAISPDMIEQYVRDRLRDWKRKPTADDPGARVKPATINADLRALHRVFSVAIRRGVVTSNPVKQVDRPREDRPAIDWFRADEFRELLMRVNNQRAQDILALFALTGIRRSEAARLEPSDIRLRLRQIVISGKTRTRVIPASPDLDGPLTRLLACAGDRLIAGGVREIDTVFRHTRKALGEPRLHPHALRHTFGTALIREGMRPDIVQKLMGHQSINTTLLYVHGVGAEAVEAIACLRLLPSTQQSQQA